MASWLTTAVEDLDQIIDYWDSFDPSSTNQEIARIRQEVDWLENNIMEGQHITGKPPEIRAWLMVKRRYWLYYERVSSKSIRILRLWSTRRKPLTPDEIVP